MCVYCLQVELAMLLNVYVRVDRIRARAMSACALSPHLHCRFELLALLGNTTEKKCSNLLIGVENTAGDVCCEEQCGTCGGRGCAMRPGGSVRWCLDIFVACPMVSSAFGES